jgi:hypothetical protein
LHKNDGLLRPEEIRHNADHFEIEFLYLVAGEDRVGVALHPRPDLVERKDLVRLRESGERKNDSYQGSATG